MEALDCLLFFGGGSALVVCVMLSGIGDSEYSSLKSSCSSLTLIEFKTDVAPSCFLVCTEVKTLWERRCCTGTSFGVSLLSVITADAFPVFSFCILPEDPDDVDLLPGRLISLSGEYLIGFRRVLLHWPLSL